MLPLILGETRFCLMLLVFLSPSLDLLWSSYSTDQEIMTADTWMWSYSGSSIRMIQPRDVQGADFLKCIYFYSLWKKNLWDYKLCSSLTKQTKTCGPNASLWILSKKLQHFGAIFAFHSHRWQKHRSTKIREGLSPFICFFCGDTESTDFRALLKHWGNTKGLCWVG